MPTTAISMIDPMPAACRFLLPLSMPQHPSKSERVGTILPYHLYSTGDDDGSQRGGGIQRQKNGRRCCLLPARHSRRRRRRPGRQAGAARSESAGWGKKMMTVKVHARINKAKSARITHYALFPPNDDPNALAKKYSAGLTYSC